MDLSDLEASNTCEEILDRVPGITRFGNLQASWYKLGIRHAHVIGSIRRDCLDHVVVLNDRHLKRILTNYFNYYHRWRTHLSLGMNSPESRSVQLPALGKVVQFPEFCGLHHHYERLVA